MNSLFMIIIAIISVVTLFIILKMHMKKIANRDINQLLLRKKNTKDYYYFFSEKTHKIYMINTQTGQLYYCLTDKTVNHNTFKPIMQDLKYTKTITDFTKLSENYYEIIENNIDFNIDSLK